MRPGRRFWPCPAAALVPLIAASCGGGRSTAIGADDLRAAAPSMELVTFVDVAREVGLDFRHSAFRWGTEPDPLAMMGAGVCWIDIDRDGWLDLFAVNTWSEGEWGQWRREGAIPTSRLFRNDAGVFTDVTEEMGAGVENRSTGCVAADLDRDGWTDLLVTTERDDVLLWNDEGKGFLDDASSATPSGLATYGWHAGAAVGDVDGNGWPDVFVAGYIDPNHPIPSATKGFPSTFAAEPDRLFLNDGPVGGARASFREVADAAGIEPEGADYGLGALFSDLDGDGDLDLYVANDTTPNQLYENTGNAPDGIPRFLERGIAAGVGDTGAGMGVAAADLDGDALPELVTTNQLDERNMLVANVTTAAGSLSFEDLRTRLAVADFGEGSTGWGVTWADIDLDGDYDLAVANGGIPVRDLEADREPMLVYETYRDSEGVLMLRDASATIGLDEVGPRLARGLAAADYDNDGDIDFAVGTIGGELALLRNTGAGGHWLTVATPAPAPGAVVSIELPDGSTQRRELVAGGSYLSSEDPRAHFGVATHVRVDRVEIRFLDGRSVVLTDVAADRIIEVDPKEAS